MAMDVQRWDKFLEVGELINKIREVLLEALTNVDPVLTVDIITMEDVVYFLMLSQCHRLCISPHLARRTKDRKANDRLLKPPDGTHPKQLLICAHLRPSAAAFVFFVIRAHPRKSVVNGFVLPSILRFLRSSAFQRFLVIDANPSRSHARHWRPSPRSNPRPDACPIRINKGSGSACDSAPSRAGAAW